MKRTVVLILALAVSGLSLEAQQPAKEAKVERLLSITKAQTMIDQMFEQMKAATAAQIPAGSTPEQRAKAAELNAKIMDLVKSRISWDKMKPVYVKLYSETFTDEEIDGMLAFYSTPAGRAVLEKMPALVPKVMSLVQAQVGDMMPEIQRIVAESQGK